ncbi:aspartate/glutamate racemase family protein [Novosphingobium sp. ZN18A2]|uniref:aspartate/glutamate racemase family protein n=1 Tax=Novosphingobium sp. ZN18A2 TaxID=3079861 RepID=UPI0030D53C05
MLTIGLLGGMSWESSAHYYRIVNQAVRAALGGTHSARSLMLSVDFADVEALQHAGEWQALGDMMLRETARLAAGGADFLVLCTNTMHLFAPQIEEHGALPLLHIADAAGQAIRSRGLQRVGLIGTRFTMEEPFYRERLAERFGIETLVPGPEAREAIHRVIYDELVQGVIRDESRAIYRDVIAALADAGAQGIVLGCTEIPLLVGEADSPVPLFDTTDLHARAAADRALAG